MKILPLLALTFVGFLLASCASTQVMPYSPVKGKLERGCPILVTTPADGQFGSRIYERSGSVMACDVGSAFETFASDIVRVPFVESVKEALALARTKKSRYLVIPKITHWEDRATEWSGRPDRVAIRMRVVDVRSGAEIVNVEIKGKSSWLTLGGDHPEQLLKEPIKAFVQTLY